MGYFDEFLLDHKAEFPFDVSPEAVGEAPVVGVAIAHSYYGRGCFFSFYFNQNTETESRRRTRAIRKPRYM